MRSLSLHATCACLSECYGVGYKGLALTLFISKIQREKNVQIKILVICFWTSTVVYHASIAVQEYGYHSVPVYI